MKCKSGISLQVRYNEYDEYEYESMNMRDHVNMSMSMYMKDDNHVCIWDVYDYERMHVHASLLHALINELFISKNKQTWKDEVMKR